MKKLFSFMVVMLCMIVVLAGCGQGNEGASGAVAKNETPEEAVTKALNATRDLDMQSISKYFGTNDILGNEGALTEAEENTRYFVENLKFKILSSEIIGDSAIVKTEITNIDMLPVFQEFVAKGLEAAFQNAFAEKPLSEEEVAKNTEELLINLLENATLTTTTVVEVKLSKLEDSWKIEMDDVLQNAMFGGLIDVGEMLQEGFGN